MVFDRFGWLNELNDSAAAVGVLCSIQPPFIGVAVIELLELICVNVGGVVREIRAPKVEYTEPYASYLFVYTRQLKQM